VKTGLREVDAPPQNIVEVCALSHNMMETATQADGDCYTG
jgi:hypothetical protein